MKTPLPPPLLRPLRPRPLDATTAPAAPSVAGANNASFMPAPLDGIAPRTIAEAASRSWARRIAEKINDVLAGKMNATLTVSLAAGADQTVIVDRRISAFSAIVLTPTNAGAATEIAAGTLFISAREGGQATIAHANNTADREFVALIIG